MTGSVHDVDMVIFVAESGVFGADCNPLLSFEIHRIHDADLGGDGLVGPEGPRLFEELIHERSFAVVNVSDDSDIADVVHDAAIERRSWGSTPPLRGN